MKILGRGVLFRLCAVLLIVFTAAVLFFWILQHHWCQEALSSSLPFIIAYGLNLVQPWMIPFCMAVSPKDTNDALWVRPAGNFGHVFGKALAILALFLGVDVLIFLLAILVQLLFSYTPVSLWAIFVYLLTSILPSLVFMIGLASLLRTVFVNRICFLLCCLFFLVFSYYYSSDWLYGLTDFWGRYQTTWISDVVGYANFRELLQQRGIYLLAGVACLLIAIIRMKRLEEVRMRRGWGVAGMILFLGCGGLAVWYICSYVSRDNVREEYRQTYLNYADCKGLYIISNDLSLEMRECGFSACSGLLLENRTLENLDSLVLYLNPGLCLETVWCEGQAVKFCRENQVVVLYKELHARDDVRLEMSYSGEVDERICYVDISGKEYSDTRVTDHNDRLIKPGIYRSAKRYAFMEKGVGVLLPECLWYPVAVPPADMEGAGSPWKNFSNFTLTVKPLGQETIISQGNVEWKSEGFFFKNNQPLPGISLCAGNYKKKSLLVDSVEVELYYFDHHASLVSAYEVLPPDWSKNLEMIFSSIRHDWGKDYLFRRLSFVETPFPFQTRQRQGSSGYDYVQPEMIFFPEALATFWVSPDIRKLRVYSWEEADRQAQISIKSRANATWVTLLGSPKYAPAALVTEYTGTIVSDIYPVINRVMGCLPVAKENIFTSYVAAFTPVDKRIRDYLAHNSLKTALADGQFTSVELDALIRLKAIDLQARISAVVSWGKVLAFKKEFLDRYSFRTVDFEVFCREFREKLGVDLKTIVEEWYNISQLPVFKIDGLRLCHYRDSEDYMAVFNVYNMGTTDGFVSVPCEADASWGREEESFHTYVIPPGGCRLIREKYGHKPSFLCMATNLAVNLPMGYRIRTEECRMEVVNDSVAGCFVTDTSAFATPAGEIIVDNDDPGFSVTGVDKRIRLADWFTPQNKDKYREIRLYDKWTNMITAGFYGYKLRSGVGKLAGKGDSKAIWRTNLEVAGDYQLWVYVPRFEEMYRDWRYKEVGISYEIIAGNEIEEVLLNVNGQDEGWMYLGDFYFPEGEARVTLSDKIEFDRKENPWQMVYADAVKWVPVKRIN